MGTSKQDGVGRGRLNTVLIGLLVTVVVCITIIAYTPALDAPFVLDDGQNIIDSPAIRWTDVSMENVDLVLNSSLLSSRPVANFSFALDHLALLRRVHEFDRIFEADDVEVPRLVEVIDHRRQRRRLTGSGAARDEHHALVVVTELFQDRRHLQLFERRYVTRDVTEHRADPRHLAKYVDTKAAAIFADVGKIEVVPFIKAILLLVRKYLEQVGL